MRLRPGIAFSALLLGACGGGDEVNNSGVTREEAEALDNAAEMLDARPERAMTAKEGANTGDLPVTGLSGNEQQ